MRGRRTKFNLGYHRLLTGDMGELLPVGLTEVIPGDSFRHSTSALIRLSPMAAPVMHPVTVRLHHFFVPHRLIWPSSQTYSFEEFITGGQNNDVVEPLPTILNTSDKGDILDYYGLPRQTGIYVSSLPVNGYNAIWNEYYKDQDLAVKREEDDVSLAKCAWEKDYLTSSRPWPQKGEDVTLPLGTRAPVHGIGKQTQVYQGVDGDVYETGRSGTVTYANHSPMGDTDADTLVRISEDPDNPGFPGVYADLADATAADVNDIRRAFALQRFAEARARYGSRYTEYLRYLGITPSDARLDRPEYLGGGRVRVSVSEVLQTTHLDEGGPGDPRFGVGDMYGHGIAAMRSNSYQRFFEEHGYVHTLMSVRPKAMYMNAVDRHWLREHREDFFQKELQFIGQQAVTAPEVYADGTNKETIFGYQDRYREYREANSTVSGDFRDTLKYWHMARDFETEPVLNEAFVECVPTKRIYNEQTTDALWVAVQHRLMARRLLSRSAAGKIF